MAQHNTTIGTTEQRTLPTAAAGFTVRTVAQGKPPKLVGYGAVFGVEAVIQSLVSEFREEIAPGAFRETLRTDDQISLFNHNENFVLGRKKAGTLELREDAHGLHATIYPPDNEWGRPVLEAVKRGDISGMSISFQVVKDEWSKPAKGELPKRIIREARLFETGPVVAPAYVTTEISARAAARAAAPTGGYSLAERQARLRQMWMQERLGVLKADVCACREYTAAERAARLRLIRLHELQLQR